EPFSSPGIQCQKRVGKQILTSPMTSEKIRSRRTRRDEDDTSIGIDGHACPTVGSAHDTLRIGFFRPGFVARFSRMGNSPEFPDKTPCHHIKSLNITRRCPCTFTQSQGHDDQIFENSPGRTRHHIFIRDIPIESRFQAHPATVPKGRNGHSGGCIQGVQPFPVSGENPCVVTRPPVTESAIARSEEHTSELQSRENLVCRLLLEKKKTISNSIVNRR